MAEERKKPAPSGKDKARKDKAGKDKAGKDKAGKDKAGKDKENNRPSTPGRLSRLRFKKKDMPGGLWLKCPSCESMIYRKELEAKDHVCPSCDFHFTVPGPDRVAMTLDEGSWDEYFADITTLDRLGFTDAILYSEKIERTIEKTGQTEALLCGTGRIEGRAVVLAVLDFKFLGGSMGEVVGEKIALAADMARLRRWPLILFTSSGGARMHEGMFSLMQMAKTCSALARLNDEGGYSICVLTNPTTGGVTASFASVCDVTLAEPGALIGFAGPRVIASTIKQELPRGFQRSEFLLERGQIDSIVVRQEMNATLAALIDYGTTTWEGYPPPVPVEEEVEEPAEGDGEASTGSDPEARESDTEPPAPLPGSGGAGDDSPFHADRDGREPDALLDDSPAPADEAVEEPQDVVGEEARSE